MDLRSIPDPIPPEEPEEEEEEEAPTAVLSGEDLIEIIEDSDDYDHVMTSIRNITFMLTDNQIDKIVDVEAEYSVYMSSENTNAENLIESLYNLVAAIREDWQTEETQPNNAINLQAFCSVQKETHLKVYNALAGSAFPYSEEQMETLRQIRFYIGRTSGHPDDHADRHMADFYDTLLDLLDSDTLASSKDRLIIYTTLDHHARLIIEELRLTVFNEERRDNPFPNNPKVNLATYVTNKIKEIYNTEVPDGREFAFRAGYREIINNIINVFRESNFPFNTYQDDYLLTLGRAANNISGDPEAEEFEVLKIQLLAYVEAIKNNHPEREIIRNSISTTLDPNGQVNQAVRRIKQGLKHLDKLTSSHYLSFNKLVTDAPDIIPLMIRHFRRIYPKQPRSARTSSPSSSNWYTFYQ